MVHAAELEFLCCYYSLTVVANKPREIVCYCNQRYRLFFDEKVHDPAARPKIRIMSAIVSIFCCNKSFGLQIDKERQITCSCRLNFGFYLMRLYQSFEVVCCEVTTVTLKRPVSHVECHICNTSIAIVYNKHQPDSSDEDSDDSDSSFDDNELNGTADDEGFNSAS
ncbi:hypothetical protein [Diatraea saccharalis granulovirus]|uniref:Uncharacterized protein n=1 Tax=Diatraea saccharalis granulovirus TaxID=1675862 RepID=A0A0R7EYN6_9BBAC|nr:hypothetical protein [Diatraea saccharalis granulovirus]AKN80708.1 hypothetical protein [Diatraea saccharalis granulovirus]